MNPESAAKRLGLDYAKGISGSGGSERHFNCPFCVSRGEPTRDTSHKLWLHVANDKKFGAYICYRCGAKGRIRVLGQIPKKVVVEEPVEEKQEEKLSLPEDFIPLCKGMHAYKYLVKRGLTEEDIRYYGAGAARGRIVFPDYIDGKLVYWVSRTYTGKMPKYFNVPMVKRTDKLYNLGRFLSMGFSTVTITEGPISAIMAGRDAVATYGKEVTETQVEMLKKLDVDRYYIALDPDAKNKSLQLARALWTGNRGVFLISMPRKEDPASLGRAEFGQCRRDAVLYDLFDKSGQIKFMVGKTRNDDGHLYEIRARASGESQITSPQM